MRCPYCAVTPEQLDELAVHMTECHAWSYDRAMDFLRELAEYGHNGLCQCDECQWCEAEMKRGNYKAVP